MFELASLKLFNALNLLFRDIVLVHVHQNILDHNDAELGLLPDIIHLLQDVLIRAMNQLLYHRLQQLNGCAPHACIQELSVLMKDQIIGSSIQLLIT